MKAENRERGRFQRELDMLRRRITDLRIPYSQHGKAQDTLEQLDERLWQAFQLITNSIPHGIMVLDSQGIITRANEKAAEMCGLNNADELVGLDAFEFIPPREREQALANSEEARLEDSQKSIEYTLLRADGLELPVESSCSVLKNASGNLIGFIAVTRDVSERRRMEEALRKSEAKYRGLVENTLAGIAATDLDGRFTFVNSGLCAMIGYPEGELIGKPFANFLHPDDKEAILRMFQERPQPPRKVIYLECKIIHKEGRIVHISASPTPIYYEDRLVGFNSIITDVTERKEAKTALKESEERFHSLFRTMKEGACIDEVIYDKGKIVDYRIVDVNPAYESLTGFKRELVVGKKASEVYRIDKPPHLDTYAEVVESGKPASFETYFPSFKKYFRVSVFSPGKGKFATVFSDITESKGTHTQLLAYQKELQSLASQLSLAEERERRRIAAQVHDRIGQTLALCQMKLGALMESEPPAAIAEPLGEMQQILRQLIEETRSLTFELSSPLLYEVGLEAAIEQLTEQMQIQHSIPCGFEDDGQPKPLTEDVRVLLFQAVQELLLNIARHAKAQHAKVNLKTYPRQLQITVEDDGIGFDTEQILGDRKRRKGFGIFSVRERLRYIGGEVEIASQPGGGTRVILKAPLERQKNRGKKT